MEFKNVVVGVDGAEGGRDAIALARMLCAPGGQLTLAHVYAGEARVWRGSSGAYDRVERERSEEVLKRARDDAGVDAELRWYGAPSPGRGLHELAESLGADLLVIGSSRRGLMGRVLTGDDTRAALNGAPCAIAVAPAGYAHQTVVVREVGVGYDGSPESDHALGVAREIAARHNARVSAFEAVSLPSYFFSGGFEYRADLIEQMVSSAKERVTALEGVEPHAAYGVPAEELALFSASVDLLVIGSRSYGPVGRLIHGSTAQALVRRAASPLLVLTRAARTADPAFAAAETAQAAQAPTAGAAAP